MKLGCLPAKTLPHQPMLTGTRMMARLPPARLIRDHINPSPRMLGNNVVGDCTSAGIGNALRAISALGGYQTDVTDDNALMFYEESAGYRGTPETDTGAVETEVLSYALRNGYPTESGTYYPLWGSTGTGRSSVALLMASLGAAYLGVQLSTSDMDNVARCGNDTVLTLDNGIPGSAGGHCLLAWDYTGLSDTDTVTLLTWGMRIKATWAWLDSRIMEAHGLLFPQLTAPTGLYPTGDDLAEIKQANRRFLCGE